MKNLILAVLLLASVGAFAETTLKTTHSKKDAFKLIHVADLASILDAKSTVYIFDANTDKTRMKDGLIPGATALTKSSNYDASSVLPPDHSAKLVFYCANTACMASHAAAKLAVKAGYTDVNVMADGIQGWKKAGKPTDKYTKTSS